MKTVVLIAIASGACISASFAATVPAGTTLVVRTMDAISSHDRVGRTFATQLDQNVAVNGKVLLPAGTKVFGRIETSRGNPHRSNPLTVNLTSISSGGRTVPIKTDGAFQPEAKSKTARQSRAGVSVGSFTLPPGTKMDFRLAQPLNL
jgi:hypothetical protein